MQYPLDYNLIIDFLYSETLAQIIFWIKLFSGILSAILFVGIVILGIKTKKFWERIGNLVKTIEAVHEIKGKEKMTKKWQEIVAKSKSHIESDHRLSIIEADKLLDELLKSMGFKGSDMGERLKGVNQNQISNINEIWQAHKIRNNLVHDAYFKPTHSDTEFVVRTYGNTLKEVGVL